MAALKTMFSTMAPFLMQAAKEGLPRFVQRSLAAAALAGLLASGQGGIALAGNVMPWELNRHLAASQSVVCSLLVASV